MDDFEVTPPGRNDVLLARIESLEANVLALRLETQALRGRTAALEPAQGLNPNRMLNPGPNLASPAVYGPLNTSRKPTVVEEVAKAFKAEEARQVHGHRTCERCGAWITPGGVANCRTEGCVYQERAAAAAQQIACPKCNMPYTYSCGPENPFTKYVYCQKSTCENYGKDAAKQED